MGKHISYFVLLTLLLSIVSCKRGKEAMLTKTWHAVTLENGQMDSVMMQSQKFIDTMGSHTDAATNMELYGFASVDSMRHMLQVQLDSVKLMQQEAVTNTVFTFRRDGVAVLTFSGNTDSTKWYFDDEGAIMLDELKEKGAGDKVRMQVMTLTDSVLKLKFTEKGPNGTVNSTVTFNPANK